MQNNDNIWNGFLDVVILPPPEVRDYAIMLSKELHQYGTAWELGPEERKPHLSLLHFPLDPACDVGDVTKAIDCLVFGGELQLTGISSPRHGAFFLDTNKPDWLTDATIQISQALWGDEIATEDPRFMERWNLLALSGRMLEAIKTWGSPFMEDDFLPHFTLGVLEDKTRAKEILASLPSLQPMSWTIDRLHIVTVDDGWTAWNVVGEIPILP